MPFAKVPGASLYYEVHPANADSALPWLAFAHGAGGNHLSWWQQVPEFVGRFRCLVYDQRGWGRSECDGAPDPAAFAGDLCALLDHVGVERTALVGQSMGGWTVLGCTLRAPRRVTHLILTGTIAGLMDDAMLTQLIARHDPSRAFDGRLALAADFPQRDPLRTFLYEGVAALNPPLAPDFLPSLIGLRYAPAADELPMPVCFIAGERDQLFPLDLIRQARAKVAHAALVVVPVAGHSVYFECPQEFNRALAAVVGR
jgi:3-oxoadipate enol-lactonase